MPKKDWKSKTRNLLPDDKHFNSRQLLRLFLKPKARLGSRRANKPAGFGSKNRDEEMPEGEMDEAFWARKENAIDDADEALPQGDYDANFFQDDGMAFPGGADDDDDIEFADAREQFSPGAEDRPGLAGALDGIPDSQDVGEGAFGTQLVTQSRRLRPEYVQYARVAKKVDVRRLKEEIWKGMGVFENPVSRMLRVDGYDLNTDSKQVNVNATRLPTPMSPSSETPKKTSVGDEAFKFTEVIQDLQKVYPKQVMNDISTSYCFICLLHLANEKGLVIEKQEGLQELRITKDHTAEITVGGGD